MTAPVPYLHFAGDAASALRYYRDVFGGELQLYTFGDFGHDGSDGSDPALIQHGELRGPVDLFGADTGGEEDVLRDAPGVSFALLGAADAAVSAAWFDRLAAAGTVVDALQKRPWGDYDGRVRDQHGITWLIGYKP